MANEKRLIDANALDAQFRETKMIEIFPNWKELSSETKSELIRFGKALKEKMQNAPAVDAVEVVHGRWVSAGGNQYTIFRRCSICCAMYDFTPNYCPNCGADMRERKDKEEIK